jgi:hypothetical protein
MESFCTRALRERFSTFSILQLLRRTPIGIIVGLRLRRQLLLTHFDW